MTELETILAAYTVGGGGVVITGAGGVGRTRLLQEAVARLTAQGCAAEWVRPTRSSTAIRFGAVAHLIPPGTGRRGPAIPRRLTDHFRAVAGGHGPVVLAVDDAHLLDDASASLVHHLAVHARAFPIVTVRTGEPAPDAITSLWKDGPASRISLSALPAPVCAELLDGLFGGRLDTVSRHALLHTGAGSPLLLRELVRAALETGALHRVEDIWRWTGGVPVTGRLTEVVAAQIGEVTGGIRAVAEVVACGEPLPVAMLHRLADERAVTAAENGNLVVTEPSGSRLVARLAHPLYGEVIRSTLPAARARTVWTGLSEVLGRTPMRRRDDLLRTGDWSLRAGLAVPPGVLLASGRRAITLLDHDLAERLARSAWARGGVQPAGRLLAEYLTHRGQYREAARYLTAPPPGGAAEEHSRWAVTRAEILYWGRSRVDEAERTLNAAAATPGRDTAEATRCWILLFDGRCREALRAGAEVLYSPSAGPDAAARSATAAIMAAGLLGRLDEAATVYRLGAWVAAHNVHSLPWARTRLSGAYCLALLANGRPADALRIAEHEHHSASTVTTAGVWAAARGLIAKTRGQMAEAAALLREGVVLLDGHDAYRLTRFRLAELAGAAALAGDTDAASVWMARADRHEPHTPRLLAPWVELNRAWILAAHGDSLRAAAQARRAAELAAATQQPLVEATALYAAARLGDARIVRGRLADLAADVNGPYAETLALASSALADQNGTGLDRVAVAFRELGLALYAAEAATAAAVAHRRAGRDRTAKRSLSMAAEDRAACAGARTPLLAVTGSPHTLTRREREVALLAAAGRSSREIALRLHVSVRTVDNHLGHVYTKLGASGRAELTALLGAEERLASDLRSSS